MSWDFLKAKETQPGSLTLDRLQRVKEMVNALMKQVDWIVMIAHDGNEYCDMSLPYIRQHCHRLLGCGIVLLLGTVLM